MAKKKTQKQREFELLLNYSGDNYDFTKKIKSEDIEIIRNHKDKIVWSTIAKRSLSEEAINEFWDNIKHSYMLYDNTHNFPIEILRSCKDIINWYGFISNVNVSRLTLDFYKEFEDELTDKIGICKDPFKLPKETFNYLVFEKPNKSFIFELSGNKNIKLKDIERLKDILDWKLLSGYSKELCKLKNFKKYENYINIKEYTNLDCVIYNTADSHIIGKLNIVLNEEFLLKYKNDIKWESVINWVYDLYYRLTRNDDKSILNNGSLKIVSNDFFKKHKDELPKKAINELKKFIREKEDVSSYKEHTFRSIDPKFIWTF